MILYRPVGQQEMELIYDGGMKAFPARLPQQPIFYPVLQLEYARQIASDWNAKNGQLAGYVTQFKVEDSYINKFEEHTVGGSQHQEFWIPAEEVEEFNQHITGHIKVVEAHFGDAFEGFVPDKFALQGKNAVEQFTLLANSYIYKRMDFFLEIKRNHKAIFLNYPFWLTYDFQNPGLKEKIIKAIKDAWFTSFPKTPLPVPPAAKEDTPLVNHANTSYPLEDDIVEDVAPEEQREIDSFEKPVHEKPAPAKKTYSISLAKPFNEGGRFGNRKASVSPVEPPHENAVPAKQTNLPSWVHRVPEEATPARQAASHFSQGVEMGLNGKYHEAVVELSNAVEKDPGHVIARTSLGIALHRLGEDDRALACYEAAIRIDPKNAEAHYFRADILYSQGNVREAIAEYTTAIGLKPDLIEAHQAPSPQDRLAEFSSVPAEMIRITRRAHRILDLNQSLETRPRQADLFKARAAEYSRLENYEQAIADYSSSLRLQPEDANTLHSRGVVYEQLGQNDRALEDYQRAIAINPQLSNEYINRGVALGNMGNLRQSIASLTEGIRLAPQNPDGYFNRGTAYFHQGDFANAIKDFSNVIRLSPGDQAAYYWRGISHEEAGRQGDAIADYRQFLAVSQDPAAREEIEQRLSQWDTGLQQHLSSHNPTEDDRQNPDEVDSEKPLQNPDLYDLLTALEDRALRSTWLGSGVECYGEGADELRSLTDQDRPIEGGDFVRITSGIQRTMQGDFIAFNPGSGSHWILIRAWNGNGFYIELDDPVSKRRLRAHFPYLEEMEGAPPPYEGWFLPI